MYLIDKELSIETFFLSLVYKNVIYRNKVIFNFKYIRM
jgi:hypothetical protein